MTPLSPTALEAAAVAALVEMDDRSLLKDVGDDLFDEIKNAVATAAITAYLAQAGKEGWVMVPRDRLAEHAAWLRVYVEESKAENWRDMKLRASRQLDDVDAMLAAAQNGGE